MKYTTRTRLTAIIGIGLLAIALVGCRRAAGVALHVQTQGKDIMNRTFRFTFALRAFAAWLAFALLLAASAPGFAKKPLLDGGGADPEVEERIDEAKDELPKSEPSTGTATIRGSVFYNDQRTDGLFADRQDRDTKTSGQRCDPKKKPECGTITKRLANLRSERKQQAALIEDFKGGSVGHLEDELDRIDAQIGVEEGKLAACQAHDCGANWLAGKYMVVDVLDCDKDVVAKATVGYAGSFKATFPVGSACKAVELRVRLRFCNSSYCFSINKRMNDPYVVVHPGTAPGNRVTVKAGDDITVPALLFGGPDPGEPDNVSIAANYYASIVDAILTLHEKNKIPFYRDEFGELQYVFPATAPCETLTSRKLTTSTATACSPTEIVISSFQSQPPDLKGAYSWDEVDGKTPAHEYGHVMMQRAWSGSYGFDGVGKSAGAEKAPSRQIAFKEAWAEFIARVVFQPTRGCDRQGFDDNGALDCAAISKRLAELNADRKMQVKTIEDFKGGSVAHLEEQLARIDTQIAAEQKKLADCRTYNVRSGDEAEEGSNLKGPLGEGAEWRDNVVKALCDWYDSTPDDDKLLAGRGDHWAAEDIHSMWDNLRRMKIDAGKYGGEYKNPGLWFCDYVRYYLDVRKSVAAVGAESHANYENLIRDLIYNNNIACSMPSPD